MIWFPEGYTWPGRRVPWLALVNPMPSVQDVSVTLFGPAGERGTRVIRLAPRARESRNVAEWFGLEGSTDFGVEVACSACAASLVMWDAAYSVPAVSAPVVGCR